MLDIRVTNDKVILEGLDVATEGIARGTLNALKRIGGNVYKLAYQWLSGPGGQTKTYRREWSAGGEVRRKTKYGAAPGGYPVPVRTGHLRRMLDWLNPGGSKSGELGTVTAGNAETVIFDSASYAWAVFQGTGSSAKFGPRNAIQDAFDLFNHGAGAQQVLSEEIRKEARVQ